MSYRDSRYVLNLINKLSLSSSKNLLPSSPQSSRQCGAAAKCTSQFSTLVSSSSRSSSRVSNAWRLSNNSPTAALNTSLINQHASPSPVVIAQVESGQKVRHCSSSRGPTYTYPPIRRNEQRPSYRVDAEQEDDEDEFFRSVALRDIVLHVLPLY